MKCEILFLKDGAVYSFELLSVGREEKGIWDVAYEIWFSSPNVKIAKAGIRQDLQCSVDFFEIYLYHKRLSFSTEENVTQIYRNMCNLKS